MFGFGYLKLAVAGVALSLIVAAAVSGYMAIKKIGSQETVISVQQNTISNLNQTLARERIQNENNKKISSKERQEFQAKIVELNKLVANGGCLDKPIRLLWQNNGSNTKPMH